MPSNDVRTLLQAAVPTAVAGAVAVAVGAGVAGGGRSRMLVAVMALHVDGFPC